MNTLVIEWTCDLCQSQEITEQSIPEGYDDIPDWMLLHTPDGWAHDVAGDKEYCAECWETVYEVWIAELPDDPI